MFLESSHKSPLITVLLQGGVMSRFHGALGVPRAQKVLGRKGIAENPCEAQDTSATEILIFPFWALIGLSENEVK